MATLDGYEVAVGDHVFSVGSGRGTITQVMTANRFMVVFDTGRSGVYEDNGRAVRASHQSLFWHNPIIAAPLKHEQSWNRLVPVVRAMIDAFLRSRLNDAN